MAHRLRFPEIRRKLLRELQRIDGPAFVTSEAAAVWEMDVEQTKQLLETMERVGLLDGKRGNSERIWWPTELAQYDVMCMAPS